MNPEPDRSTEEELEYEVYVALLHSGARFPETPEEVRAIQERHDAQRTAIPPQLRDAASVWAERTVNSRPESNVLPMPSNQFAEAKEELTRAARNGQSSLSTSVEEKMRLNRQRAKAGNGK
jgi:hypothetical protein